MNGKQRTIKTPVSVSGTGLHTGEKVTMTFNPAPENHGYKFRRIDIQGSPIIDADCDNVTDTSRGTTISQNGASVSTIEHVLAALVGMEIDNVLIDMDGLVARPQQSRALRHRYFGNVDPAELDLRRLHPDLVAAVLPRTVGLGPNDLFA